MMRNYWFSAATERIGMIPIAPFWATSTQAENHQDEWAEQNLQNKMVMLYEPDEMAPGPPQRQVPPSVPAGELSLMTQATGAVYDAVGLHQPSLGEPSPHRSGRAILAQQQKGDLGTFDFQYNLAAAIESIGTQIIDMTPVVYGGEQIAHLVLPDQTGAFIPLNYPIQDEETGRIIHLNPIGMGRYVCRVDVGPGFQTAQQQFLDFILQWQQNDPQGFQLIKHKAIQAMDIPGKDEIVRVLLHAAPREILSPEEEMIVGPPQPSPEHAMEAAAAEAEAAKQQAEVRIMQLKVEQEQIKTQREQLQLQQMQRQMP